MTELFTDSEYYTGPAVDGDVVAAAERDLGYKLPDRYVRAVQEKNGGRLVRNCIRTSFETPSAPGYVEIKALLGLTGKWGITSGSEMSSRYMIEEWGYPDIGVVLALLPSGGHDTLMLDYSKCGKEGEPSVVYVDEDRIPRLVADSFSAFIDALVPVSEIE